MKITSINPTNGEIIKEYTTHSDADVANKIKQTHEAWLNWRGTSHD